MTFYKALIYKTFVEYSYIILIKTYRMSRKHIPLGFIKGSKIRELRQKENISPSKFAGMVDIHTTRLSAIENTLVKPVNLSAYNLAKIAHCLRVDINELIDSTKIKID